MKKKNSLIPFCLLLLILFFLSGCVSYNEFAQRKYLKGNFYDKAERYPVIHLKECRTETPQADTVTNVNIDPLATAALGGVKNNSLELYLKKNIRIWDKLIPSGEQIISKKIILSKKKVSILPYKTPESDPEKCSRRARLFGVLSLVSHLYVFVGLVLVLIFAIIALVNASKVLNYSLGNEVQIKRARTGKTLAIISLCLFIIMLSLYILLMSLLSGGISIG